MIGSHGLILAVDDEPDLTSTICDYLKLEGYGTLEAHDGTEALKILRERRSEISLVLCDITMLHLNGLDLLKICLSEFGYLPIVMISAHEDSARVTEAVRLGAIDYVVKPFDTTTLVAQIPVWQEIGRRQAESIGNSKSARMEGLLRVQSSRFQKSG